MLVLHDDLRLQVTLSALALPASPTNHRSSPPTYRALASAGDTPAVINDAVCHPITGDGAEEPRFDWIKDHDGRWFEIALSPIDGVPTRVLVENGPGTELGIHYLCLSYFWPDGEGGDR